MQRDSGQVRDGFITNIDDRMNMLVRKSGNTIKASDNRYTEVVTFSETTLRALNRFRWDIVNQLSFYYQMLDNSLDEK